MSRSFLFFIFSATMLVLSIAMPGCHKHTVAGSNTASSSTANAKTYLALGDSYTIGQSVAINERFPYLVVESLRNNNIAVGEPRYIATTGWTTADLQNAINTENPPSSFDIVTLLIGVNDQYQHRDTADYRVRFTQLLNKSIQLAGKRKNRVFVLSIPDYSATPFVSANEKTRVSNEISWFNAINKEVTGQYGISYTDITPLSREVANDPSLLANDGLHYSGKEHRKWADVLVPAIRSALQ